MTLPAAARRAVRRLLPTALLMYYTFSTQAQGYLLLPMDQTQKEHLKAYGIMYDALNKGLEGWWLLNYRGGSFAMPYSDAFRKECLIRNVTCEQIPTVRFDKILSEIAHPEVNMDAVKLEKAPKIAVYTPDKNYSQEGGGRETQPWDDAVTLVLTYAEIPYDRLYDDEVLRGDLSKYDWLHLHHEDFTGQYGKFYATYASYAWYKEQVAAAEACAARNGFKKVSQLKLAVAEAIRRYVAAGGYMFAMCSATDTYDICLAAHATDICADIYDHDPMDPQAQNKLDFSQTFAFQNFNLVRDPLRYEYSDIDATETRRVDMAVDYFTLFEFSAKWDPIPTMLTQSHTRTIKGFMGQTTAFRKETIKSSALVMGENKAAHEARYLHGEFGRGFWSFYGGHDPEDYRHMVGDPPTDLSLHPNSPGYRLILNNILFPAAKKKHQKT